jgi:hypothetical protein
LPTDRARLEWTNRVIAEYRSAATAARTLHLGIACGLPSELLAVAARIVTDEVAHAEISHATLVAIGGSEHPVALDVADLLLTTADPPLAELTDRVVAGFAMGETFAVPLFAAMRANAGLPAAREALDRILRDEAVHRAFGWDALDALLAIDPVGVRERLTASWPRWIADFRRSYGVAVDGVPLSPDEIAAGLLPSSAYVAIFEETTADIRGRLQRRDITVP